MTDSTDQSPAIAMIIARRKKHAAHEGWNPPTNDGELAIAAACYALAEDAREVYRDNTMPSFWPWGEEWWKPGDGSIDGRIRELTKAGALIASELDRLLRIKTGGEGGA